jgi:hypothetical protein
MRLRRLVVWLALAGCGPSSYRDFRDQLAARSCDRDRRCGVVGPAEQRCRVPPALALTVPGSLDVPQAVDDGRLRYDSNAAQGCLDALGGAPCDDAATALRVLQHCHAVIGPKVESGGACDGDEECIGGRCVGAPGCAGVCVAYPAPGGACVPDGGVADCDPTVQYCDGAKCQRHKQSGASCTRDAECAFALVCRGKCGAAPRTGDGKPCAMDAPCGDGSYCAGGGCTPRVPSGTSCLDPAACQTGLGCQGFGVDGGVRAGVCEPWRDIGQPCALGAAGTSCPSSQLCQPNAGADLDGGLGGLCAAGASAPAGPHEACMARPCADGLFCSVSATCEYLIGRNGGCDPANGSSCTPGLACDPASHRCLSPSASSCAPPDAGI